jgi:hypothetical protein
MGLSPWTHLTFWKNQYRIYFRYHLLSTIDAAIVIEYKRVDWEPAWDPTEMLGKAAAEI